MSPPLPAPVSVVFLYARADSIRAAMERESDRDSLLALDAALASVERQIERLAR